MKTIQFELWAECNVNCRFCYLNSRVRKTEEASKLEEMDKAEAFLSRDDFGEYTNVAFIGGEFLQGQLTTHAVRRQFFRLLQRTKDLILEGRLQGAWLSAALTHTSGDLYEVLEMFKDITPTSNTGGFWIVSSYDERYRFTEKNRRTWENHMIMIKDNYPNIRLNTTIILTQAIVDRYLSGNLVFHKFIDTYGTQLFFKPPHSIHGIYKSKEEMESKMPGFFLRRKDFLKFLTKVYTEEECFIFDKMLNIHFRADTLFRSGEDRPEFREKETRYEIANETFLKCGHPSPYAGYIDSDACMLCDKLMIS